MIIFSIVLAKVKALHSQRGQETSLVLPELQNKHLVRSFFLLKNLFPESEIQNFHIVARTIIAGLYDIIQQDMLDYII